MKRRGDRRGRRVTQDFARRLSTPIVVRLFLRHRHRRRRRIFRCALKLVNAGLVLRRRVYRFCRQLQRVSVLITSPRLRLKAHRHRQPCHDREART